MSFTTGEKLIGHFNPNDCEVIARIKDLSQHLIDEIEHLKSQSSDNLAKEVCDRAKLDVLSAQMLAVKSKYILVS